MSKAQEDESQLVDNDELTIPDIQPHLRGPDDPGDPDRPSAGGTTSLEYINPALDVGDDESPQQNTNSVHTSTPQELQNSQQNGRNGTGSQSIRNSDHSECVSSPPVYYSNRTGEPVVIAEPVVVRHPNGVHEIRTQQCCELAPHRHRQARPLKKKKIKLLQAFSIVSVFVFFPLGIPAMYYAFKCEKEFEAGVMRGNIDLAQKYARRAERFMIFSVLAAILVAVAVFAIVERMLMKDDEEYWESRSNNVFPHG